jgi:hypothetical protein
MTLQTTQREKNRWFTVSTKRTDIEPKVQQGMYSAYVSQTAERGQNVQPSNRNRYVHRYGSTIVTVVPFTIIHVKFSVSCCNTYS